MENTRQNRPVTPQVLWLLWVVGAWTFSVIGLVAIVYTSVGLIDDPRVPPFWQALLTGGGVGYISGMLFYTCLGYHCRHCGFSIPPHRVVKQGNLHFCSHQCRDEEDATIEAKFRSNYNQSPR